MVQRYPSSGKPAELQRPPAPPSVVNAVKLMYAGAAVSTVSLVISLADISGTKAAIRRARPSLTATQVNQLNTFIISLAIVSGLIGIGLWLWMAYANKAGKNWARITATVFFGLDTLSILTSFRQGEPVFSRLISILIWLIGLGAIVLLYQRQSSAYFGASKTPR